MKRNYIIIGFLIGLFCGAIFAIGLLSKENNYDTSLQDTVQQCMQLDQTLQVMAENCYNK